MPLEGNIVQLFFLDVIGAFNLDNVPGLVYSGVKDVHPAVEPVTREAGLK